MIFPSLSARSAPRLSEPSTTRRSTAAADPILAGVTSSVPLCEGVTDAPIRGDYLRMAFLRFRLAYIMVAILRSTALRRVVDGSLDHHRHAHGETSSSLLPDVNTVRPHPSGSGRSVLTPGPHRLLKNNQAPHLWCVASKRQSERPSRGRLTGRSTSTPGTGTHSSARSSPSCLIRPGNCGHCFAWKGISHVHTEGEQPRAAEVPARDQGACRPDGPRAAARGPR